MPGAPGREAERAPWPEDHDCSVPRMLSLASSNDSGRPGFCRCDLGRILT